MKRGSLRLRLLVAGAVSVLAALALSALGLVLLFENHVERRVEAELNVYLDQIVAGLERSADGRLRLAGPTADPRFAEPLSGLYWQIQANGNTMRSRSLWDASLPLTPETLADGTVRQHRIPGPGGSELLALERSITLPEHLGGGTMRAAVAVDRAEISAASRAFAVDLLPYLGVIAAFLIAASYGQVAVGLRPLAAVRRRLAAIRAGQARRLGQVFPDEIQPLAAEVDALLEAREQQIERARMRAGDLAHGLKTPLQALAGDIERLKMKGEAEIAGGVEQVANAMRQHVERELARARMAAANPDARAKVAEVVKRVVAVVARTPAGAQLEWTVDIPAELAARIDPDDLAEAVGNLTENAARHARECVSIRSSERAGLTIVTVADDGPGIPEERLQEALARGGRLDQSGSGAGLGLAIVRDIAEAWGGHFEIRTSSQGLEADLGVRSLISPVASVFP